MSIPSVQPVVWWLTSTVGPNQWPWLLGKEEEMITDEYQGEKWSGNQSTVTDLAQFLNICSLEGLKKSIHLC